MANEGLYITGIGGKKLVWQVMGSVAQTHEEEQLTWQGRSSVIQACEETPLTWQVRKSVV